VLVQVGEAHYFLDVRIRDPVAAGCRSTRRLAFGLQARGCRAGSVESADDQIKVLSPIRGGGIGWRAEPDADVVHSMFPPGVERAAGR
jgi:hypothetical protein